MQSFKTYLKEGCSGNYVCLESEDLSSFFDLVGVPAPKTGDLPPDYHCTLMYSKRSNIEPQRVLSLLKSSGFDKPYEVEIGAYDAFDSLPKGGLRDEAKACLVAKITCGCLHQLHDFLKGMGMIHSYSEFSPHLTLRYNMDIEEAHKYKELLAGKTLKVMLFNFRSETINESYV